MSRYRCTNCGIEVDTGASGMPTSTSYGECPVRRDGRSHGPNMSRSHKIHHWKRM